MEDQTFSLLYMLANNLTPNTSGDLYTLFGISALTYESFGSMTSC